MIKLDRTNTNREWNGFKLKSGFWYGTDTETGQHVATSEWEDLLDGSIQGEEIEEEYQRYLYDDLPKFIRKYL